MLAVVERWRHTHAAFSLMACLAAFAPMLGCGGTASAESDSVPVAGGDVKVGGAANPPSVMPSTTKLLLSREAVRPVGSNEYYATFGGIASDPSGRLYIADVDRIIYLDLDGTRGVLSAGCGSRRLNIDGPNGIACFYALNGRLARDRAGNLYAIDAFSIRKVAPDGAVTTVTDYQKRYGARQSNTASAMPASIAIDDQGVLYVSVSEPKFDAWLEKIDPNGTITRLYSGGVGNLAIDQDQNVYFLKGSQILKRDAQGNTELLVDSSVYLGSLVLGADGLLYGTDASANAVYRIKPTGEVALIATLNYPQSIASINEKSVAVVAQEGLFHITLP